MRGLPLGSRVLGLALALLLVNLLWNAPLRDATGGGLLAYFLLNLLPSAAACTWVLLGGAPRGTWT